jgi:uncharacterized membrane protein (UPF0182 family)
VAFEMPGFGDEEHGSEADRRRQGGAGAGRGSGGGARLAFPVPPRRTKVLAITLAVLVVLIVGFLLFDTVFTDFLWFRSVGFSSVYRTRLTTQISLFLVFGLIMAVVVTANIWLAHRFRPPLTGVSLEQQALDRYRMAITPFLRVLLVVVGLLLGIVAGISAIGAWRTYLMWSNAVPFGTQDTQFHKDIGFYVFTLPWLRYLQGFLLTATILSLIAAVATHYLYAGVSLTPPSGSRSGAKGLGSRATRAAQVHVSILLGVLVLVKAYAYWLDRYSLTVASSNITNGWAGPTYKSVHAVLPAKSILMVIAILCAVLFFANAARLIAGRNTPDINAGGHSWALPALGVSLMILSSVLIGGVYPLAVQQFQVNPSQAVKEAPYIQRNIDATRAAYGISGVDVKPYDAKTDVTPGQLATDAETVTQVRIMDPAVISATFDQTQQVRGFYSFPDDLSVDRYTLGGNSQDSVVAVRELNLNGVAASQRNWVNDHLKYTHGYGFVAAKGNTSVNGAPDYLEQNIPSTGALGTYEQRVYFGEGSPDYSIVGGTSKSTPAEFDYPDDKAPSQQQSTTYTGKGGVPVGSFFNKMLYATKFKDMKILLSSGVNQDSHIIYDRDPKQRVQAVAPWLTVDGTTYPAVVDGRILWIVDGYTTTSAYPSSTTTQFSDVAKDSLTGSANNPLGAGKANYIRNSVKATVDAYDGTVTLYAWDDTDPILKAWSKAFPGTVQPKSAISPELMSHLRYPQDLFKAQRDILGRYHVTDPQVFFGGSGFWSVPTDPTKDAGTGTAADQPPYYLTLQMPGQSAPSFSLTSTLVPTNRSNLAAFVAVDADPGRDYGKIRALELPANTRIPGPGQMQNKLRTTFADTINLLRTGGATKVVEGNLLTLPVGGGLLYVEPIYAQAVSGEASYPILKKVMVSFGDTIALEDTLQQGLDRVFQGNSGATVPSTPGVPSTSLTPELRSAIDAVTKAQNDLNTALAKAPTDWVAIGTAQKALQDAITNLGTVEKGGTAPSPTTPPSTAPATPPPTTPTTP